MEQDTKYVAFDTSKETLAVAVAQSGRQKEVRVFCAIPNRPEAVRKLVERLARQHPRLAFCYEAGPMGYGLYRQISAQGIRLPGGSAYDVSHAAQRGTSTRIEP